MNIGTKMETARLVQRQLEASFLFGPLVIAWRCSLCRKLFCVPTIHDGVRGNGPPDYLRRDFEKHSCVLNLYHEFAHKQVRA